jgi:N-acetylglutamate synthase-like GNAT family acetyltransferase
MVRLDVKDVTSENIDDLINLCIPSERKSDSSFVEGAKLKRKWAVKALKMYGCVAKVAYLGSKPVGLIQYQLVPEDGVVEVSCVFVPERENLRRGVGKALFEAILEEVRKPQPLLRGEVPDALVTWAFQVPERYPQNEFFQRMGFKKVEGDDPFLLYYPLKEGYVYEPREKKYVPQKEDRGKALVFYDPSCPFSMYFAEAIKKSIGEVAPEIPVRMINRFEEVEEVKRRGKVPACAVNGKAIQTFFMDKENFQKEVKEALGSNV